MINIPGKDITIYLENRCISIYQLYLCIDLRIILEDTFSKFDKYPVPVYMTCPTIMKVIYDWKISFNVYMVEQTYDHTYDITDSLIFNNLSTKKCIKAIETFDSFVQPKQKVKL